MTKKSNKLRRNEEEMPPDIIHGSLSNDLNEVRAALRVNADSVNEARPSDQLTPLHIAAGTGNFKLAELLAAQAGLDLRKKDKWGRDPLDVAIEQGNSDIVAFLFRLRAERSAPAADDDHGQSNPPRNIVRFKPS